MDLIQALIVNGDDLLSSSDDIVSEIKNFIADHRVFLIVLVLVYLAGIVTILTGFAFPPLPELEVKFYVFGLSLQSLIFIWLISIYLLARWYRTGRKNHSNLFFGLSFLIYSWLFIGMLLSSFLNSNGQLLFAIADTREVVPFFFWRQSMIIWAAGMWYGISLLLTDRKSLQIVPTLLTLIIFYGWFIYGLFVLRDVTQTMYGFLFLCFIPVCSTISYMFYLYSKKSGLVAPRYLAVGFAFLSAIYAAWGPWHYTDHEIYGNGLFMYYILFFLFVISLVIIYIGFMLIPWEQDSAKYKDIR